MSHGIVGLNIIKYKYNIKKEGKYEKVNTSLF